MSKGVHFRASDELLERLDSVCREQKKNRTDVILECLWAVLLPHKKRDKDGKKGIFGKVFGR